MKSLGLQGRHQMESEGEDVRNTSDRFKHSERICQFLWQRRERWQLSIIYHWESNKNYAEINQTLTL